MNQIKPFIDFRFLPLSVLALSVCLCMISCNKKSGSQNAPNLEGFEIIDLGEGVSQAKKYKNENAILEEGYLTDGNKNGAWINYHPENGRIQTIQTYTNGLLNGPAMEMDQRGQVIKKATYVNNILNGEKGEYKHGRAVKITPYINGIKEGTYKEYFTNGKLQKEIQYKNDIIDGKFRQYKNDGTILLEYIYKNGEKVSGGIIE